MKHRLNKALVLHELAKHVGKASGIRGHKLALVLRMPERKLRGYITQLRESGTAVCGHPSTGYYIAANGDELDETCAFLRSRAMKSLTLEATLRKISLPELIGQMRLPT